jgi:hypothetical protein
VLFANLAHLAVIDGRVVCGDCAEAWFLAEAGACASWISASTNLDGHEQRGCYDVGAGRS